MTFYIHNNFTTNIIADIEKKVSKFGVVHCLMWCVHFNVVYVLMWCLCVFQCGVVCDLINAEVPRQEAIVILDRHCGHTLSDH